MGKHGSNYDEMYGSPPSICMSAIDEIAAERKRQIEGEGWTPEHDARHIDGELARAAGCYALGVKLAQWPWNASWWKPKGRRRNLVRAGALIVAEIERIDHKYKQS